MKVILQQNVANVGEKFSVATVPDGYALNKLIPTGKAVVATTQNLRALEGRQAKQQTEHEQAAATFTQAVAVLREKPLVIPMETNGQGQLFQALPAEKVAEAAGAVDAPITPAMVQFDGPIKTTGSHEITLAGAGQRVPVTIEVVAA